MIPYTPKVVSIHEIKAEADRVVGLLDALHEVDGFPATPRDLAIYQCFMQLHYVVVELVYKLEEIELARSGSQGPQLSEWDQVVGRTHRGLPGSQASPHPYCSRCGHPHPEGRHARDFRDP